MVDRKTGRLIYAPRLGWRDVDLRSAVAQRVGMRCYIESAPIACALARLWLDPDATRAVNSFAYVSVSDGIGVGLAFNGEMLRGESAHRRRVRSRLARLVRSEVRLRQARMLGGARLQLRDGGPVRRASHRCSAAAERRAEARHARRDPARHRRGRPPRARRRARGGRRRSSRRVSTSARGSRSW